MNAFEQKLLGELIGLARATDGNEHLITQDVTALITECLNTPLDREETLSDLLYRVGQAKREMVPDCFLCANPCGRTSAYDMDHIRREPPENRELKYSLMGQLKDLSGPQLYRGLILLGLEGYTAGELRSMMEES